MKQFRLLALAALGLALVILAGCGGSSSSSSSESESTAASGGETTAASEESSGGGGGSLTFVSYGEGTYQGGQESAWVEPFSAKTGAKVTIDSPTENAKLSAMVEAGNVSWDVVDTDPFFARQYCEKFVSPIDIGSLANSFAKGTVSKCGVPDAYFGLELMYNEKTYGDNPPTSLSDFFNTEKFPGQRIIMSGEVTTGLLEAALLAEGTPPDKLYPLDVKKALSIYDKIKPELTLAETYDQQQQAMVGNQADMALVVSARAYSVLEAGGTFWKPVWDKVPITWDALVIPKGAPNEATAQEFIKFASEPEQSAGFASAAGVGPANIEAEPKLNALQEEVNAFSPEHKKNQVIVDAKWWTENLESTVEEWTNWTTGG